MIGKKEEYLFIQKSESEDKLVGELAGNYSTVVLMFGFAVAAMAPALIISRIIRIGNLNNFDEYDFAIISAQAFEVS